MCAKSADYVDMYVYVDVVQVNNVGASSWDYIWIL